MRAEDLVVQIKELKHELIEARLSAEEAWQAYDYAIEREKRRDSAA